MDLNTKRRATKIRFRFLAFAFLTVALVATLIFTIDFEKHKLVVFGVIGMAILIYVVYGLKRFMYFSYNDDSDKIIVRYFNLIPSTLDHHSIEIPKRSFVSYEVKRSRLNLRDELILVQKTKNGIAKYPPVSITILNNSEKRALKESLSKYVRN